ncbi:hypothetical protein CcrC1_gp263c [Caulobacter phage C1]|nr:hypothetical protein CcrC1_gp263c [Caulobacter phage C1]UTU08492.1 hypothetical protein CcrC2_gp264c [Caulobacter phage C2]UTU09007.1 hypothetical protein CcrJ4_gp258c [Caulobacter phage J4]UTU09568.1 hypothetical protein CcrBL47_gp282c [Caulobacter phage BL47]UTU10125.1 hypothetical protein CcrRB23_gp263c [Caulobacter phage RB23]WGN97677.1 hypothetical protein [Bertelyvirus sp.]
MDPFQQGQFAYAQGQPQSACPYGFFDLDRWSWLDGWRYQRDLMAG